MIAGDSLYGPLLRHLGSYNQGSIFNTFGASLAFISQTQIGKEQKAP